MKTDTRIPDKWFVRFTDDTPLTEKEMQAFADEAGPNFEAWIKSIETVGTLLGDETG